MPNNEEKTEQVKLCPFLGKDCIQGKCALWTEITISKPSKPGLPQVVEKRGVCAFIALGIFASMPKIQPVARQIQMPPGFNPLGRG